MRQYETVCIIKTDAGDEVIKGIIQKAKSAASADGGRVDSLDEWGRRRLAYPIQKKGEGYYFVLSYTSTPDVSKEVERGLKFNENVIRYQTIRLERPVPAKAEAKKTADEQPKEAQGQ